MVVGMKEFAYFVHGGADPSYYREPLDEPYRRLERWDRRESSWVPAVPRRRYNDPIEQVSLDAIPAHLRKDSAE